MCVPLGGFRLLDLFYFFAQGEKKVKSSKQMALRGQFRDMNNICPI